MDYQRLSFEEREEISRMLSGGLSLRAISEALKRSPSTISRELDRTKTPYYRALSGHVRSIRRSRSRRLGQSKIDANPELLKVIINKIQLFWSPEQIANYLKETYDCKSMHASKDTIYTYIYVQPRGELRDQLIRHLRDKHLKRRVQGKSAAGQKSDLADMISIEQRPKEVEDRTIPGHWEGDIIIGDARKQTALGTLVERKSRAVILVPLKSKKAADVRKAFAKEVKKLPKELRLTLTYDQGREMAEHKLFTKQTKMQVYFAHPQSPWERGSNENTNRLIRDFFPKSTDFTKVTRKEIKRVQHLLNERPRKTLNFRTPYEIFEQVLR
jgi:IS30 family transposase